MPTICRREGVWSRNDLRGAILLRLALPSAAILVAFAAMAQDSRPTQPAPQVAQPPQAAQPDPLPRPSEPGLFGAVGRFIDESITGMTSGIKGAHDSIGQATGRAGEAAKGAVKDAATTVGRLPPLPKMLVVTGREVCTIAPNGAADCRAATEALCRSQGFASGNSLEITTAQNCPAQVWISGRTPAENECTDEAFVTRAMCQ